MRKNKNGIVFDSTIYISEENQRRFPYHMRVLQFFSVLIGGYCFLEIFIKCFNLRILDSLLILGIIISSCVFFFMILYPKYDLIKFVFFLVTYGALLHYGRKQLLNGFYLLENAIINKASEYYDFPPFRYLADYSYVQRDITYLLLIIIIPIIGIITLSLLRNKLDWLCYLLMPIPLVVSFAMGDTPPEIPTIAQILILLFISISNGLLGNMDYSHKNSNKVEKSMVYRINIRTAIVVCLLGLLLFFIVRLFVPLEKYNAYEKITIAKSKIQNFMMDFSAQDISDKFAEAGLSIGSGSSSSAGGLSLGQLGKVDQVTYDNSEHLQIRAPLDSVMEGIYLKGYIGSVYTGNRWDTHTKDIKENYENMISKISAREFEPAIGSSILLNQLAYRLFILQGSIDITYLRANSKYVYAPYFTWFKNNNDIIFDYDLAVISDKKIKAESFDYCYNLTVNDNLINSYNELLWNAGDLEVYLSQFIKNEEQYRSFVYETYTKLPQEGLDRLKNDFSKEAVGKEAENLADAITYIKNYLESTTSYTLSPGRLPKGKDFVEYFLYENKLGYCAHYASAGALMLRTMGYPARYVEGYAINRSDISDINQDDIMVEITVKDYNAHAWVEVYYDGFGWIPVEFTRDSGMEDYVEIVSNMDHLSEEAINNIHSPSPTNLPSPTPATPSPTEAPDEEIIPTQKEEKNNKAAKLNDNKNNSKSNFAWYLVFILILILGASAILYYIRLSNKKKIDDCENHSKKALGLYRKIELLLIISNKLPAKSKYLEANEEYVKKQFNKAILNDFEKSMEIIRKARFGREIITPMEYMVVEEFYNNLFQRIYDKLPWIKRTYIKIFF